MDIKTSLSSINIAEDLDKQKLLEIANQIVDGYDTDKDSRKPWEKDLKTWTELALQVSTPKTFPWTNAANIKYPLLATAAMQFAARAYPTLVPSSGKIVKCRVVGKDEDGEKAKRAYRISTHMSYQVLDQMDDWEEEMDKLLITLPIAGTCFKKTYWNSSKEQICSKLVLPKTLVVNYFCRNLDEAERITEVYYLSKRVIRERINQDLFLDELEKMGDPQVMGDDEETTSTNKTFQLNADQDETTPYTILEQHTYLDLDDDGYQEPYIVTVDYNSRRVLRIVARFSEDGIRINEDGKISSIEATQYYTKYDFIPNPDGGFYSIGFGRLLGPLNESANTLINQLVDAGSLSNLQAGFIGKGLRLKMGMSPFQPGEWKAVNAVGDDIKKQVFPLPVREPSNVLLQLLDLLLKSGNQLASVAEIFVGKMPGQNTPATTTQATIEQGMKVFTAVYKRIYRSLAKEFRKIYTLNREYMNPEEYIDVLDEPVQQSDYMGPENDVIPGADPTAVSSQEKQAKAEAVMKVLQLGTVNPMWATSLYMDANEIPGWQQGVMQPQPKQDPKVEAMKAKSQLDQQKAQNDIQMAQAKLEMDRVSKEQELQMKARAHQQELQGKQLEAVLKSRSAQLDLAAKQQAHQQIMVQSQQNHVLQQKQIQEKQKTLKKEKKPNGGNK